MGNRCLNHPPRQPASDPRRKIRFREEAREIVARDRKDRKYGRAVDTVRVPVDREHRFRLIVNTQSGRS